jgi:hypothetical protein
MAQPWLLELDDVLPTTPPPDDAWPVGPNHRDLYIEGAGRAVDVDLRTTDCAARTVNYLAEPSDQPVAPWQVLVLYSTEPDSELDMGLDLSRLQSFTKGSHGFRHMEFRLLGFKIGMLRETFMHHVAAAEHAFKIGNAYWGWRYLSRATHYLADIGHPFHVRVFPRKISPLIAMRPKRLLALLSSLHNAHEVFTEEMFRRESASLRDALLEGSARVSLEPATPFRRDVDAYYRDSERKATALFDLMRKTFGPGLTRIYDGMDEHGDLDLAKRTQFVEEAARSFIFQDPPRQGLTDLEAFTASLLGRVGQELGRLLQRTKRFLV